MLSRGFSASAALCRSGPLRTTAPSLLRALHTPLPSVLSAAAVPTSHFPSSSSLSWLPRTSLSSLATSRMRESPSTAQSSTALLGRRGSEYFLSPAQVEDYHRNGYIHLRGVLSEEELREIEKVYMDFMERRIHVPGKDLCDMSGDFDRRFEDYSIINAMLPRVYHPPLQGNLYERRAASITRQLFNDPNFGIDYDQLLAKKPTKGDAIFAWHVDLAYWPLTPDTRTATFSLALDATTKANGCLRFVNGSHKEPTIRPHRPVNQDRNKAHAIVCDVNERTEDNPDGELVSYCEVARGDVTVHNERVVHGSGGNYTSGWRRTYVLAFRHQSTIDMERKVFHKWQEQEGEDKQAQVQ